EVQIAKIHRSACGVPMVRPLLRACYPGNGQEPVVHRVGIDSPQANVRPAAIPAAVADGKVKSNERGVTEIEQSGRDCVVLHQGQPSKLVFLDRWSAEIHARPRLELA